MNLTCCGLSPYQNHEQYPITGLLLANHTSVSTCLKAIHDDFEKMWKKRANGLFYLIYNLVFFCIFLLFITLIFTLPLIKSKITNCSVHAFESAFEQEGDKESGKKNLENKINESKDSLESLLELYQDACTERYIKYYLSQSLTSKFY